MRPLKLTMQAFGPYLIKQTLDFGSGSEEGALLITGRAGSGKTSLIEALFFALFGYSGLEGDNKLKDLRNVDARPELPTEVVLDFLQGAKHYRIVRHLVLKEKGIHTCCLGWDVTLESLDDKEYIAIGCCEVNSVIEFVLGLESNDYISLVLPFPGHINSMISLEQGMNKAFLQRIFQADYLENIWPEILKQSSSLLQHFSRDKFSFIIPEAGSAVFQDDYYTLTLKDKSGSTKKAPQSLTAGTRAIILTSLHLGIMKTLQQHSGTNHTSCLFLDRFLELLDQVSLEKYISGLHGQTLKGTRMIVTTSNPQHQQYFVAVGEVKVDQTSRELVRLAELCRAGMAKKYGKIDPVRQKRLDYELVYAISKFSGEALAETNEAYQGGSGKDTQPPAHLRDMLSTLNTLLELAAYLRKNKIPFCAGSGRSNGSYALYVLGITEIDPVALKLSAGQFYSPLHRGRPLPVWFDLPDQYQDKVFNYAVNKYDRQTAELLFPGIDCLAMWYFTEALNKIHQITRAIEQNRGEKLELSKIPLDDQETFDLLATGNTGGIYGLSGVMDITAPFDRALKDKYQAQMVENDEISKTLQDYKPVNFEQLMLIIAIFNLGPLVNQWREILPRVLKHRRDKTTDKHDLPVLQESLECTHGLLVYREQLLEIIMAISRFNITEAERFFKLILSGYVGDKEKEAFQAKESIFIERGQANGYTETHLNNVLKFLYAGANTASIKSNAANHTLVAYRMAYLKTHCREVFESITKNEGYK